MTDVLVGPSTIVPTIPARATVPCVYCRAAIPSDSFVDWADGKPLLSADCPSCTRRVTLPGASLRRWIHDSEAARS